MAFNTENYYHFTFRRKDDPTRVFHGAGWSALGLEKAKLAYARIVNNNPDNETFDPAIDIVELSSPEKMEALKTAHDAALIAGGNQTVEEMTDGQPGRLLAAAAPEPVDE